VEKMDKEGEQERGAETNKGQGRTKKKEHKNKECIRGDSKERNKRGIEIKNRRPYDIAGYLIYHFSRRLEQCLTPAKKVLKLFKIFSVFRQT